MNMNRTFALLLSTAIAFAVYYMVQKSLSLWEKSYAQETETYRTNLATERSKLISETEGWDDPNATNRRLETIEMFDMWVGMTISSRNSSPLIFLFKFKMIIAGITAIWVWSKFFGSFAPYLQTRPE